MSKPESPPTIDETVTVKIVTPGGLIITIDAGQTPPANVREAIAARCDDRAARTLSNLTGCTCSIERLKQTTVRPN